VAGAAALAPVLDGSASVLPWVWLAFAFLLEASAWDALGGESAADRALERALDLAEPAARCCGFLLPRCRPCWNARSGTVPPTPP
jgi:LuxR family transcriptional regulator, maltose regulon positive regulatory protein